MNPKLQHYVCLAWSGVEIQLSLGHFLYKNHSVVCIYSWGITKTVIIWYSHFWRYRWQLGCNIWVHWHQDYTKLQGQRSLQSIITRMHFLTLYSFVIALGYINKDLNMSTLQNAFHEGMKSLLALNLSTLQTFTLLSLLLRRRKIIVA